MHGKPHREQDQIEMAMFLVIKNKKSSLVSHQGWLLELNGDI